MFPAFEPLRIQGVQRVLILSTAPGPRAFKRRVLMLIAKDGTMIHINGNSLICSDGKIYQLNGRILTGPNGTVSMNVGSMAEAAGIAAGFHGGRKL